jgi:hypothetical protein
MKDGGRIGFKGPFFKAWSKSPDLIDYMLQVFRYLFQKKLPFASV